ncbi:MULTISPECIES: MFS transporter [unclassified Chelatococcus]|uniref:MFS transporter n=1 Tax=unclassified Chelatococcus TaxID=2638111 RepID=UPI001BCBB50E|nr:MULTISPECIES: MFS transporter [unclassified Chelatococcus]CAH1659841.1 fosmidomycin efflux pump [Hyphomicrobiales bacterium]MBS7740998.1 MFS transporter [Chelatococcus sp. HY11]MBX3545184.1 MFS transporter [Chelatococcus sp.]MCO5077817.1 MFS transporter [Chelatococcus sp.]CAH1683678.1 fosmidomycin efflux pump [Hyphomicrobiales bacterium]
MAVEAETSQNAAAGVKRGGAVIGILSAISLSHLLNDTIQSLVPAIYPVLKDGFHLDFGQIGLITLAFNLTASLLQPAVGLYTDKHPQPFSLAVGMGVTLSGVVLLSMAHSFGMIVLAVSLIGTGSAIFHPESSRVARMASGGRHGFAQSFFQVGGNVGSSLGPLLAAFIVLPYGQPSLAWFSLIALTGIIVLTRVGFWYRNEGRRPKAAAVSLAAGVEAIFSRGTVARAIGILIVLIFSKYFYMAAMGSYYTFFIIEKFGVSVRDAQLYLFVFLGAVALGTFVGGPMGDRFGRKYVIWFSILGVLPFTLILPHVNLFWTVVSSVAIGIILASAFSSILVYAQELMPGKVGTISGLFFGFAFGMGGLGAAVLGQLADHTSIRFVFNLCSFLPLLGILAAFLPNTRRKTPVVVKDQ